MTVWVVVLVTQKWYPDSECRSLLRAYSKESAAVAWCESRHETSSEWYEIEEVDFVD